MRRAFREYGLSIVLGLFLVCLWLLHMFVLDKAVVFAPSRVTIPAIAGSSSRYR